MTKADVLRRRIEELEVQNRRYLIGWEAEGADATLYREQLIEAEQRIAKALAHVADWEDRDDPDGISIYTLAPLVRAALTEETDQDGLTDDERKEALMMWHQVHASKPTPEQFEQARQQAKERASGHSGGVQDHVTGETRKSVAWASAQCALVCWTVVCLDAALNHGAIVWAIPLAVAGVVNSFIACDLISDARRKLRGQQ